MNLKATFIRRFRATRQQKEAAPFRMSQYKVNPWLNKLSDTFVGCFDPILNEAVSTWPIDAIKSYHIKIVAA
jgi:hypothetical protein